MIGTFGGVSGHRRPINRLGATPRPNMGAARAQNSHISQMVLEGQNEYQTVAYSTVDYQLSLDRRLN